MEDQEQPFKYTPLEASEIRLVKIQKAPQESKSTCLSLGHYDVKNSPPYFALSYAWGDPNRTVQIHLDGLPFHITTKLSEALRAIQDTLSTFENALYHASTSEPQAHFWIDALCINQADLDEKSRQVGRMIAMYSQAYTTLIG